MKQLIFNKKAITVKDLKLKHTLINGQCFNWHPLN
jgi:hypothetical protein